MSARKGVPAALLACALAAGCVTGGDLDRLPSARTPSGAHATIALRAGLSRSVELLSMDDASLIVLHNDSVKTVGWSAIGRINVPGLDTWTRPFPDRERAEILRTTRFPYGIPADVMTTLLERAGQTAPAVLE